MPILRTRRPKWLKKLGGGSAGFGQPTSTTISKLKLLLPAVHPKTTNIEPHRPYKKKILRKGSERPKNTKATARKTTQNIIVDPKLSEFPDIKEKIILEQAQPKN